MWILIALMLLVAAILATSHLLSTELELGTKRTCVHRLVQCIPLQSVKVVIVAWQIVVQVRYNNCGLASEPCSKTLTHFFPGKFHAKHVFVCVFSSHPFWTSSSLDVPAGVTQEEGHTGFLIHLLSAVRALIFIARRIQPFLSLVDREVEFCVLTI